MREPTSHSYVAVLIALLLSGCDAGGDAVLVCSLDGKAFFIENRLSWVVRRVPSADRLCPHATSLHPQEKS